MLRPVLPLLLFAAAALGGCVSNGKDGPSLQLASAESPAASAPSGAWPTGSFAAIAFAPAHESPSPHETAAPKDMMAEAPLPPPRPVELGGKESGLFAVAETEIEGEEDEPVSTAAASLPEPAPEPSAAEPAPGKPGEKPAEVPAKPKGPGFYAAYDTTIVSCFPEALRTALDTIAEHFNKPVEVASGMRTRGRRGSMHRHCMAADIRIAGISPSAIVAYAKTVPGLNGIGSYRRTDLIHVDIRQEQMAWRY